MKTFPPYAGKSAYQGDLAKNYDRDRATEAVWQAEQRWIEAWVAGVAPVSSVLDLPAGTGRFTPLLLARGLTVHAMDISADMLSQIRTRHVDALGPQLTVQTGDAEKIALPDHSVDYVISWRFLHLLPVPVLARVLGEFGRVARREVVVQVFSVRTAGDLSAAWFSCKRMLRPVVRLVRRPPAAPLWGHIESFSHRESTLQKAWELAGLRLRSAETLTDYLGLPVRVYRLVPGAS